MRRVGWFAALLFVVAIVLFCLYVFGEKNDPAHLGLGLAFLTGGLLVGGLPENL